jgi:hypothetical protein
VVESNLFEAFGMKSREIHIDLKGHSFASADFDADERRLISELKQHAGKSGDWNDYSNYWMPRVSDFYAARGLTRREIRDTAVYRIAQDIGSRIAVAAGSARLPDYRDELETIIRKKFPTRRAFCDATGLSEDMLSHVLARRKHLAVDTLEEALSRIGYALHLVPQEKIKS